jgi:hypothetical protein
MSLTIQPSVYQPYAESARPRSGRDPSADAETPKSEGKAAPQVQGQSEQQKKVIEELKTRDREVRAHEQAHVAAAGGLAQGGPTYTYQYGPDGRAYAIGGEVNIDTSPGRTPEETIDKARQIRAAALAPSDPSDHDRAVAAAAQLEAQARQELAQQKAEEGAQAGAPAEASGSPQEATDKAQQAAALYGAIASATNQGALVNVSA